MVVATESRAQLGLDRVLLVVAGDPWQKRGRVVASAADRLALVDAAVDGVDGVEASAIEIERDAASVTADTLEALTAPDRELFLVLGADAVANMGTWRRLEETRDLATVVVVERAGDAHAEPPGLRLAGASGWPSRASTSSSTDLRERLRERPPDRRPGPARGRARHPRPRPLHWRQMTLRSNRRLTPVAPVSDAYRRAGIAAHAADDKKGEDIVVLDVGDIISIAEVFVLVERLEHPPGAHHRRRDRARAQGGRRRGARAASRASTTRPGCSWTTAT